MDYQSFKRLAIAQANQLGIEKFELYYESGAEISIGAYQHEISEFSSSETGGVCFRAIVEGKMGYASTQVLSQQEASALVIRAVDNARSLENDQPVFLCEGGKAYAPATDVSYPLSETDAMIATALASQDALYAADAAVIDGCQSQVISQHSQIDIYNSLGLDVHCENDMAAVMAMALVTNGQEMANSYEIKLGNLEQIDLAKLANKAVTEAKQQLGGDVAPTGQYPVVFDPKAMMNLLSVFSAIFSSETAQKGLSQLAGKEGEQIAASCVTLVDDPFHPESPVHRSFDAEGCPTSKKNIIENGKLCTLLYNLKTAHQAGCQSTGNASKASYDSAVAVKPFTMYLENGTLTEEQLLQEAGNGVYICSLGGLHAGANPISGDFSLESAGYLIEDGRKTGYVKSFTGAGNFYTMLQNIRCLANNGTLPFAIGTTNFGSPSVLVDGLTIAGK